MATRPNSGGLNFSPKVGQILECNFGNYPTLPIGAERSPSQINFDGRISPEMVKNRLVIVLNGKLGDACLVVPLSSTLDQFKLTKGWHVEISTASIPDLRFFAATTRWAKADLVQQVSKQRLRVPKSSSGDFLGRLLLSPDLVTEIQCAIVKAINASSLLQPTETTQSETTEAKELVGAV